MGIKPIKRIKVPGAFTKDAVKKKTGILNKAYKTGRTLPDDIFLTQHINFSDMQTLPIDTNFI
jgi:hypothetical protein